MAQTHPHNEFDKQFASLSPVQLKAEVNAASARVQKLDTSGGAKLTSDHLKDMKVAEMGLSALESAGKNRGLDKPAPGHNGGPGGAVLGFGIRQLGQAAVAGAIGTVCPPAGIMAGALFASSEIARATRVGPQSDSRILSPSVGYMASSNDHAAGKGSSLFGAGASAATTRATSFAQESDQVRGGIATSTAAAFGRSAKSDRVPNVFEQKFAEVPISPAEHFNTKRNLQAVRLQMANVAELSQTGVDAKSNMMADSAKARLMDNGENLRGVAKTGKIGLGQTGFMGEKESQDFAKLAVKPYQYSALTLG